MWEIIFVILAALLFIFMLVIANKAGHQFRDKSLDVKEGMSEDEVIDIMEKDPLSIEQLKNGNYAYVYEKKEWKGWGMMIMKIEIIFSVEGKVITVERFKTYDSKNNKH